MKSNAILARLDAIEARNKQVGNDKAWETSWTRRLSIMVLTYLVVSLYLAFVVHIDPWINALVPVIGFGLSTLTLDVIKQEWLAQKSRRPLRRSR